MFFKEQCVMMTLPQSLSSIRVLALRAAQAINLVVSQVGNPDLRYSMRAIVQLETFINEPELSNVSNSFRLIK